MVPNEVFMAFPQPQCGATFLERSQRFLAYMELADGSKELVYCANSGAMVGDLSSGLRALIWDSEDTARKRRYTWRAIEIDGIWIGTDTHLANRIVEKTLRWGLIPTLQGYDSVDREQIVAPGVRVDFLISGASGQCLVEVKSSNIVENGVARYPDSPTPRGVKQLKVLAQKASEGHRCVVVFLVQRGDAQSFSVSKFGGSEYYMAFQAAIRSGVEIIVMAVSVHPEGFGYPTFLPNLPTINEITNVPEEVICAAPHQNAPRNGKNCHG